MYKRDDTQQLTADDNAIKLGWRLNYFRAVGRSFGAAAGIMSFAILFGYLSQLEALYRPIPNGPATHPMTGLLILCCGFSLSQIRNRNLSRFCFFPALFVTVITAAQLFGLSVLVDFLTPFLSIVEREQDAGLVNDIGSNSAAMLLALSLSIHAMLYKRYRLSQFFGFISLIFPLFSITGYAYGITGFFGHMSLITTSFGLFLSVGALFLTASRGAVKALLSPYIGGQIARIQVLLGLLIPLVVGFLLVRSLVVSGNENAFGTYAVIICWFIVLLVTFSAIVQERVDVKRRKAEYDLNRAAMTDALTGIPNRRQLLHSIGREIARAKRFNTPLYFLMIDADHFKSINDKAGHHIGDEVLIAIAGVIRDCVRETDCCGRIGGEEFAVLLTDTDESGARIVAERIRTDIEKLDVAGYSERFGLVTVSIGVSMWCQGDKVTDMMTRADKALYQAKTQGRNRTVFASSVMHESPALALLK